MSLSFRPAQASDLPRCQALLATLVPEVYSVEVWDALPSLWSRLRSERRLEIHVFEDSARPAAQKVFCMASGVFVTPEFVADLLAAPRPYLASEIYRRELAGDSVILSRAVIAGANAGPGIDAVGLDYAVERLRWTDLAGLRVLPLIPESLRAWIGGYRINSLHRELFERELHIMARAAGLRRRKPSRSLLQAAGSRRTLRPTLFGLTRAEALAHPGSAASLHFLYADPILRFTPAQQELLTLALFGQADTEAANTLDISLSTVKKHWGAVFERVARVRPDWLPHHAIGSDDGKRGVEKRRHLLNYLRQHPEELRPLA